MNNLLTITVLLSIFHNSQQTCTSTVAITTCTSDTLRSAKSLKIQDYRPFLSFAKGNLEDIPSEIFKFVPYVSRIQLSGNKIKRIDSNAFLGLQALIELNLYDNQLTSLERDVFKHCETLEKLDLGMNKISVIHEKAFEGLTNLKTLNLGFNRLTSVPISINSLTQLTTLNLNNNAIENIKSHSFLKLVNLEKLFLNDNKITTVQSEGFKGLKGLKDLDLRSNYLTDLNVKELADEASSLRVISLSINDFGCDVLSEIVNRLKKSNVEVVRGVSKSQNNVNGITCKKLRQ